VTWLGLGVCGLVIATAGVLGVLRIVDGPRTVNHVRCLESKNGSTCVHDRYSGSPVSRPWMIVAGTLSICAGAVGLTLLKHRKRLSAG
jgi:hypothetical protein